MDELKPCPFCGGKVAFYGVDSYFVACCRCEAQTKRCRTAEEAIAAWNRRTAPENKPLTLEQLRKMARDLMSSCVVRETGKSDCAAIIDYDNIGKFGPKNNIIAIVSAFGTPLLEKDYGKTWIAYARKPEGSEP